MAVRFLSMKQWLQSGIVPLTMLVGWSCAPSSDSGSGWYDEVKEHSQQRDAYVDMMKEQGVSELEAKRAWQRDQIKGNTPGTWREHELTGESLQEALDH